MFMKRIKAKQQPPVKAYIMNTHTFDFGPLLIGKDPESKAFTQGEKTLTKKQRPDKIEEYRKNSAGYSNTNRIQ